jgi:hypothetical protein
MNWVESKDSERPLNYDCPPGDPQFYQVSATFFSSDDEHYYGPGQNQEANLDRRGRQVEC